MPLMPAWPTVRLPAVGLMTPPGRPRDCQQATERAMDAAKVIAVRLCGKDGQRRLATLWRDPSMDVRGAAPSEKAGHWIRGAGRRGRRARDSEEGCGGRENGARGDDGG